MVRFILIMAIILAAAGLAFYLISVWRERNILRTRDEDEDV